MHNDKKKSENPIHWYVLSLVSLLTLGNEMKFVIMLQKSNMSQETMNLLYDDIILESFWKLFIMKLFPHKQLVKVIHFCVYGYLISLVGTPKLFFNTYTRIICQLISLFFLDLDSKSNFPPENVKFEKRKKSLERAKSDLKIFFQVLNHFSEGIIIFDSKGQKKFFNSSLLDVLETNENITLDELNKTLFDLQLREINKVSQEHKPDSPVDSAQGLSVGLEENTYKERAQRISLLKDLYYFSFNTPESSQYLTIFHAKQYHKHTQEWHNMQIQAKVILENEERYLLFFIKDLTEYDRRAINLEKEKLIYRDNLIASFSHELRTPLNSNLGFLEQSIDSSLIPDEAKEKFLKPALTSGKLLFFIVSDILDYSLILAHGLKLEIQSKSILQTVYECLELIQLKLLEKKIEFKLTFEGIGPEKISTDHKRLSQILINLLNNAVQFTMKGKIEIIISWPSTTKLQISVKDTGIGMDSKTQSRLKNNLDQDELNERVNDWSVGIGLGLFIANKLSKMLNTDKQTGVKFCSTKGHGSTFYFEVKDQKTFQEVFELNPKRLSGLELDQQLSLNTKVRQYHTPVLKNSFRLSARNSTVNSAIKTKVLIVDDEIFNIIVIENFCQSIGISTEKALNGQEAIEKLRNSHDNGLSIKIIFMDINMPVMDGYQATREIHKMTEKGEIEDVTIIGVTAYISWDKVEKGYRSGMTEILNKPVSKETITTVLKKYRAI